MSETIQFSLAFGLTIIVIIITTAVSRKQRGKKK